MDEGHLIINMAAALALAFVVGYVAKQIGLPTIVGYLVAGLILSPFSPGWDADLETIRSLAELGVIFLMFGIGLHFDLNDLRSVRGVALPGAAGTILAMTATGTAIGLAFGMPVEEGIVLGLALSIYSGAVMSRTLIDRGLIQSIPGRFAVGWSITEDLATVLMIAVLPSLGTGGGNFFEDTGIALGKAALFLGLMLIVGARVIPLVLRRAVGTGSRELFILGVVACALGIAASATWFDVSVALGAFVAGVAISETEMGHQATADVLPLREAFAVLFFVSVGMLIDLELLAQQLDVLAAVTVAVVAVKSIVVVGLFAFFPHPGRTALIVAASIAHIGEFSFVIANVGLNSEILTGETYNVILGAACLSIALNPLWFRLLIPAERALQYAGPMWRYLDRQGPVPVTGAVRPGHVVVLGYGRVGELTGHALESLDVPFVIVEGDLERARRLSKAGFAVVWGDASNASILEQANIEQASLLVAALPDEASTVLAVQHARRVAPNVPIIARARLRDELAMLRMSGVSEAVVPEYEGGLELMRQALTYLGYPEEEAERYRQAIRDIHYDAAAKPDWRTP